MLISQENLQKNHIYKSPFQPEKMLYGLQPFMFLEIVEGLSNGDGCYKILTKNGIEIKWFAQERSFEEIL